MHTPEAVGEPYLSRLRDAIAASGEPSEVRRGAAEKLADRRAIRLELDEGTYEGPCSLARDDVAALPVSFGDKSTGFMFVSPPRGSLSSSALEALREITQVAGATMVRLAELLASEQSLLGDLVGALSDGVYMFGQDGTMLAVNPAFESALGVDARHQSIDALLTMIYDEGSWVRRDTESSPRARHRRRLDRW